jgi:hypothetical protein
MNSRICSNCTHCRLFTPRPDEIIRGFFGLECRKLGWEGYTSDERMACDGMFWQVNQHFSCPSCGPHVKAGEDL